MPEENQVKSEDLKTEIEVFKTGTHTDSSGNTKEWTSEELETIVSQYNAKIQENVSNERPLVKGHPKDDSPAYGWTESLKKVGDKIVASVRLTKDFAEEVKQGAYRKVSIALDGLLNLRHIGFLGAMNPAVDGLQPVELSSGDTAIDFAFSVNVNKKDDGTEIVSFEFADTQELQEETIKRSLKYGIKIIGDGILDKSGIYSDLDEDDFADPVNYDWPIDNESNLRSSYKTWDRYEYSNKERQVILARMFDKAAKLGVVLRDEDRFYNSSFTQEQLIQFEANKPEKYADYEEQDFADPSNFQFPIKTADEIRSSWAHFKQPTSQSNFNEEQKLNIGSKIVNAAKLNSIKIDPGKIDYLDFSSLSIPIDQLSKRQLANHILSNNNKEFSMDPTQWAQLVKEITDLANEKIGPEGGAEFQAILNKYQPATPATPPATPPVAPPVPGTAMSEMPQEFKDALNDFKAKADEREALINEVAELKKDKRTNEFKEFLQENKNNVAEGKATELAMNILEMSHDSDGKFEFSEGENKQELTLHQAFKEFVKTNRPVDLTNYGENAEENGKLSSFSAPQGAVIDDSKDANIEKAEELMADARKEGRELEFADAYSQVLLNGGK